MKMDTMSNADLQAAIDSIFESILKADTRMPNTVYEFMIDTHKELVECQVERAQRGEVLLPLPGPFPSIL